MRLLPNRAITIMMIKTASISKNIIHQKLKIIIVNTVTMVIKTLSNQFEKISITILCQLSHHFEIILLDFHVHSHSVLLLSDFKYFDRYSS
jgi:hypothetical protein